jgi:hypothetical protein
MIQTNLRETDMADIDAERFAADLNGFRHGGPDQRGRHHRKLSDHLPFHFRGPISPATVWRHLRVCHREGIRVLARTEFSKIRGHCTRSTLLGVRTAAGDIVDFEGDVHACINGENQHILALEIIRECLTAHEFDGIFSIWPDTRSATTRTVSRDLPL